MLVFINQVTNACLSIEYAYTSCCYDLIFKATTLPAIDTGNSNLTTGAVICGHIGKALRQRKNSMSTPRRAFTIAIKPSAEEKKPEAYSYQTSRAMTGFKAERRQFSSDQMTKKEGELETDSGVASSHLSSQCEAVSESEMECDTIEALQMDCAEVLKELEDWKREFNRFVFEFPLCWSKCTADR